MKNQFSCMPPRRKTAMVLLGGAVITTTAGNSYYAILPSQENGRGHSATMQCTHNTCKIGKKGEYALSSLICLFLSFISCSRHIIPWAPRRFSFPSHLFADFWLQLCTWTDAHVVSCSIKFTPFF